MAAANQQIPEPEGLKKWWAGFKRNKKDVVQPDTRGIFGVPLEESIKYANVAISLVDEEGKSFIYGYVPIVVAKCGVFLKEKATDVEGIFRLSGSEKRIKELKAQFDAPTRYGKGLVWTGYTVHDAANVLRRYLNQLPQPIVPLEAYEKFRNPLRDHQTQAVGNVEALKDVGGFDHDKAIRTYQELIKELPALNRQLLLYVLDLLSVFASKADINRMNSANLAAIFQPGLLSHPIHDMKPHEYRLSQDVLIFLIDNQDSFLFGMTGTAADEQTVREVQSGAPTPQPATPTKSGLGRSASSASAGTESQRRLGGLRRNLSVSSRNSKTSTGPNAPNSPGVALASSTSGVHRSNTVPSKKSPALSSRVNRGLESPNTPVALSPALASPQPRSNSPASKLTPPPTVLGLSHQSQSSMIPVESSSTGALSGRPDATKDQSKERLVPDENTVSQNYEAAPPPATTPVKSRNFSSLLKSSPTSENKEQRQPNKLKKKRMPSSTQQSANSSTQSFQNGEDRGTPLASPGLGLRADPAGPHNPAIQNTAPTPISDQAPRIGEGLEEAMGPSDLEASHQPSEGTLRAKSPVSSARSKASATDQSEHEHGEETRAEQYEKKRRWRFSHAPKKSEYQSQSSSSPVMGPNNLAGASSSSIGSWHKAGKSTSNDIPAAPLEPVASEQTQVQSESISSKDREFPDDIEKRGLFGRLRHKIHHAKEERKDKDTDKERTKSQSQEANQSSNSKQNKPIAIESTVIEEPAREATTNSLTAKASTSSLVETSPIAQSTDAAPHYAEVSALQQNDSNSTAKSEVEPKTDTLVSSPIERTQ